MVLMEDFLYAAEAYSDLGWAVQEQLRDLVDRNFQPGSLNDNAVAMIERFINNLPAAFEAYDLEEAIAEYRALEEEFDESWGVEDE